MAGKQQAEYSDSPYSGAEYSSNTEIAARLLDLRRRKAVDVGCGEGAFTRFMAKAGAEVTGIDINRQVLDRAAARAAHEGIAVRWLNAQAESMPFEDESLDIVVFSNSLHHVPPDRMDQALDESRRVLKPGGILYIMEPIAAGPYFQATRLVSDETIVRDRARAAVRAVEGRGFAMRHEIVYRAPKDYDSFEAYREDQIRRAPKRERMFLENGDEIRRQFLNHARREDGRIRFDQLFRVHHLQKRG